MSNLGTLVKEINQISDVSKDVIMELPVESKAEAIQLLLTSAMHIIEIAKFVAEPDRIRFSFLNVTMRYNDMEELASDPPPGQTFEEYLAAPKVLVKGKAKLIADSIWLSSDNCIENQDVIWDGDNPFPIVEHD